MSEETQLWVKCGACDHTWAAAYLPMEIRKIGKLMKGLCCQKCGEGAKHLFMASKADIAAAISKKP